MNIHNKAIYDCDTPMIKNPVYNVWYNMLKRCNDIYIINYGNQTIKMLLFVKNG